MVLGSGRSGTSLVANILNDFGVNVYSSGKADLYNAKGYWESDEINRLNTLVMAKAGGTSYYPPTHITSKMYTGKKFAKLRERAEALVSKMNSSFGLWGWKDARFNFTFPFWNSILPRTKVIICIRNPVEAVRSMSIMDRNNNLYFLYSMWFKHNFYAIKNTTGIDRMIVFYEDFFTDTTQLDRMFEFLNPPLSKEQVSRKVSETIQRNLRHHESSLGEVLSNPSVPFECKWLYFLLRSPKHTSLLLDTFNAMVQSTIIYSKTPLKIRFYTEILNSIGLDLAEILPFR